MNKEQCAVCSKVVGDDASYFMDKCYHPNCFVCHICGKPLAGAIRIHDVDELCHEKCFETTEADICFECHEILDYESGRPFVQSGKHKYHEKCFTCYQCKRSLSGKKFMRTNFRKYCQACK